MKKITYKAHNNFTKNEPVIFQHIPGVWEIGVFVKSNYENNKDFPFTVSTYIGMQTPYNCREVKVCVSLNDNIHLLNQEQ